MTAIDQAVELFGVGPSLREARLRRGLELSEVERATCIRAANLAAIEDERFDDLAADVYTAGFVRSYAEYLGLDGDIFVERFRALRGELHEPIVHDALATVGRRPPLRVAALALAVALAAVAAFLLLRPGETPAPPSAPPPAGPAPVARPPAPKLPNPLVIRAARGDTWVSVRFGDEHGRVVWQGTLHRRQQLRFGLDRPLWVGFGRPEDVTVRAGEKRLRLAPARSQFVFAHGGVRRG